MDNLPVVVLSTFGWCLVSSVVPVVNAEIYLLGVSAAASPAAAVPLILAATAGQMLGKTAMFLAGRGTIRLPSERLRRKVAAARERVGGQAAASGTVLFASASLGIPPFYLVAIASGMLGVPLARFASIGSLGRALRFSFFVLGPQAAKMMGG